MNTTYRTDKQFMKNPATTASRVYIGGLTKTVVADDLNAKFSRHGKILGVSINSGFAFIQYETEIEAQMAIKAENGSNIMGRKIIVRQAFPPKNNKDGGSSGSGTQQNQNQPKPSDTPLPLLQQQSSIPSASMESFQTERFHFEPPASVSDDLEIERPQSVQPAMQQPHQFSQQQQKFNEEDRSSGNGGGGGGGGRKRMGRGNRGGSRGRDKQQRDLSLPPPPPPQSRDMVPLPPPRDLLYENDRAGSYFPRGEYGMDNYGPLPPLPPPRHLDINQPIDKNDCEIIVVSRELTGYAEFIESRLKHLKLAVDLLFPNDDVPIGRVLANISSRGCYFAILVMPQNEKHHSLTLNILYGIPQEHRNMPLEDALILISRNFDAFMKGNILPPKDPNKMNLEDEHPQHIQNIINLLAENRMLSTSHYDTIINYLQQRRDLQYEHEVIEPSGQDKDNNHILPNPSKQSKLENHILNILNKPADPVIPTSITAKDNNSSSGGGSHKDAPPPLLKDPSVQKALDSILSGDMFKNLTSSGTT